MDAAGPDGLVRWLLASIAGAADTSQLHPGIGGSGAG